MLSRKLNKMAKLTKMSMFNLQYIRNYNKFVVVTVQTYNTVNFSELHCSCML